MNTNENITEKYINDLANAARAISGSILSDYNNGQKEIEVLEKKINDISTIIEGRRKK